MNVSHSDDFHVSVVHYTGAIQVLQLGGGGGGVYGSAQISVLKVQRYEGGGCQISKKKKRYVRMEWSHIATPLS